MDEILELIVTVELPVTWTGNTYRYGTGHNYITGNFGTLTACIAYAR